MAASGSRQVQGQVSSGFAGVRGAFSDNFARRHELGGACSVFHQGQKVVDVWGGIRNVETGEPWEENTVIIALRDALRAAIAARPTVSDRAVA